MNEQCYETKRLKTHHLYISFDLLIEAFHFQHENQIQRFQKYNSANRAAIVVSGRGLMSKSAFARNHRHDSCQGDWIHC